MNIWGKADLAESNRRLSGIVTQYRRTELLGHLMRTTIREMAPRMLQFFSRLLFYHSKVGTTTIYTIKIPVG
jgi:hypothetical protein